MYIHYIASQYIFTFCLHVHEQDPYPCDSFRSWSYKMLHIKAHSYIHTHSYTNLYIYSYVATATSYIGADFQGVSISSLYSNPPCSYLQD